MKISKEMLKEIIKEELQHLDEQEQPESDFGRDTASKTAISKNLRSRSKEAVKQTGVDNRERGMIQRIEKNLAKLADLTDIKTGKVFSILKKLNDMIEKEISDMSNRGNKNEKWYEAYHGVLEV